MKNKFNHLSIGGNLFKGTFHTSPKVKEMNQK